MRSCGGESRSATGDVVRWPYGAAETAPIDERDVAAVAARALCEDGHTGGDYVVTGPESLSQAEQVSAIGAALGRQIRFEDLSPEEFRRETAGRWPPPVVDMLLAAWSATIGRPAFVTSAVGDAVGSPPRTFRQWAADHADAFRSRPASHESGRSAGQSGHVRVLLKDSTNRSAAVGLREVSVWRSWDANHPTRPDCPVPTLCCLPAIVLRCR